MAERTGIEWTDATWNPLVGCSVISPGCTNCYAMKLAARLERMGSPIYRGLTQQTQAGAVWTGRVEQSNWGAQTAPLRWKRPRRIFVNSMSDLFHESVPDEWIDQVFAVMALAPQHTFQVLTKRADRMRRYINTVADESTQETARRLACGMNAARFPSPKSDVLWPLPNVWLGVSVEDQTRADERIPHLLATPAAVRFLSCEPLLGPVDLTAVQQTVDPGFFGDCLCWYHKGKCHADAGIEYPTISWVIAGGESGPGARPSHPDWFRSLRDQCRASKVPFFFKQWGEWTPCSSVDIYCHGPRHNERQFPNSPGIAWLRDGRICLRDFSVAEHQTRIQSGIARTTRAIEVDESALRDFHTSIDDPHRSFDNPLGYQWMYRVGKKRAGAMLDGREWREMPA